MIVSVTVPVGAAACGSTVRIVLPEAVTTAGMNCETVWAGSPVSLNVVFPANPFKAVTETLKFARFPRVTDRLVGAALSEKSAPAWEFTTNVTLVA